MTQKYTVASSTGTADRVVHSREAAIQLSDGTFVFTYLSGNGLANPLVWTSDRATITQLTASIPGSGSDAYTAICRDSSDNLFVAANAGNALHVQAWAKGAGHTWTSQTAWADTARTGNTPGISIVWCNTGGGSGGKGHVLVAVNGSSTGGGGGTASIIWILDAGLLLSGTGQSPTQVVMPPALPGAVSAVGVSNVITEFEPDGLGATSGLIVSENYVATTPATQLRVASWSITSSGQFSSASILDMQTGTIGAGKVVRCIRYAPGLWVVVYPSTVTAGSLMAALFSSSSLIATGRENLPVTNWPTTLASGANWDAGLDPAVSGQIWVYSWSSAVGGADSMLRLRAQITGATVQWDGAAVADDTGVGSGTDSTVVAVKTPYDSTKKADWIIQNQNGSTYALLGDYTSYLGPSAPTLNTPGSCLALDTSNGLTATWTHNPSPGTGATQTAYAFRRFGYTTGGVYEWWDGTRWQGKNLLTDDQASFEGSLANWAVFGGTCALAQTTAQAFDRANSMSITTLLAGTVTAYVIASVPPLGAPPSATYSFVVRGNESYTFQARLRASSAARSCTLRVNWYQASGAASAVRSNDTVTVTDSTTAWVQAVSTVISPSDAAYAAILVSVAGTLVNEVHYVDAVSLAVGNITTFGLSPETFITSSVSSLAFPSGGVNNGRIFYWSVATKDINGTSPYAADREFVPMAALGSLGPPSIETGKTLPYIAKLYSSSGTFKQSFPILNTPDLSLALNSAGGAITLDLAAPLSLAVSGDIVKLTQDGGDGNVVFTGIVEDLPDDRGASNAHSLTVFAIGNQLGDTPFENNYIASTALGQIVRDIVSSCSNLSWDSTSIPLWNIGVVYDFSGQSMTCLTALEEMRKSAGVTFYWFIDATGKVWFQPSQVAQTPVLHSIPTAVLTTARKYTAPISKQKNIVRGYGAGTPPITAVYDNSAGNPLGKRVLSPALNYPKLTDLSTLQSIVTSVGQALDRPQVKVELDIVGYGTRIMPGDTLRYFEESVNERLESAAGSGAYSPVYVVLSNNISGPRQYVVVSDAPVTLDDLKYQADTMINRLSTVV